MNKFDNVLMYKTRLNVLDANTIFFISDIVNDYYILRKYDTIYNEYEDLVAFSKEYVEENMYTATAFFENSIYVGKNGYYKDMIEIEKYIFETLTLVYKDEFNELLYDNITGNFFISPSKYEIDDFIYSKDQNTKVTFKRGLGKK